MTAKSALFLSWAYQNGRTKDLAQALDVEAVFSVAPRRWPTPVRYLLDAARTFYVLTRDRPRCVLVMQPPLPLLLVAWLWASVRRARLIGDLHSGAFNDPKWSWGTTCALRLLKAHSVIVTNQRLAQRCEEAGVQRIFVLHDVLSALTPRGGLDRGTDGSVLVPFSFANDEPVDALMEAAGKLPDVTFKVTGQPTAHFEAMRPPNVQFTGFVSDSEYEELCQRAGVFVALTTREDTMQRAGYEAMLHEKPLVISGTDVLREFFCESALYVDNSADSIAASLQTAMSRPDHLRTTMRRRREAALAEQRAALDAVRAYVASCSS
jgi:glycosyltransferase involved in cell wall biosynthesis